MTTAGATVSMLNSEQILALTHGQIVLYKHEPSGTSPGVTSLHTHFPVTVFLQLSHFLSLEFGTLSLSSYFIDVRNIGPLYSIYFQFHFQTRYDRLSGPY